MSRLRTLGKLLSRLVFSKILQATSGCSPLIILTRTHCTFRDVPFNSYFKYCYVAICLLWSFSHIATATLLQSCRYDCGLYTMLCMESWNGKKMDVGSCEPVKSVCHLLYAVTFHLIQNHICCITVLWNFLLNGSTWMWTTGSWLRAAFYCPQGMRFRVMILSRSIATMDDLLQLLLGSFWLCY